MPFFNAEDEEVEKAAKTKPSKPPASCPIPTKVPTTVFPRPAQLSLPASVALPPSAQFQRMLNQNLRDVCNDGEGIKIFGPKEMDDALRKLEDKEYDDALIKLQGECQHASFPKSGVQRHDGLWWTGKICPDCQWMFNPSLSTSYVDRKIITV